MSPMPERTRQILDPVSTIAAYSSTLALPIFGFVWAVISAISTALTTSRPALVWISLTVFAVACVILAVGASLERAPFTPRSHVSMQVLAVLAFAISAAANWGSEEFIVRSWAPLGIGALLLAAAPYRPARELMVGGALSAGMGGVITSIHAWGTGTDGPVVGYGLVAGVAVFALAGGASAYSSSILTSVRLGERRADAAAETLATQLRDGIEHSVRNDRVTILGRDVVPFFGELLDSGRVSDADRERARALAVTVRNAMVADADRSWLEADDLGGGVHTSARTVVNDPLGLASVMNAGQRTALRAVVIALVDDPATAGQVAVSISEEHGRPLGVLSVDFDGAEHPVRTRFEPYLAVLRVAFGNTTVNVHHHSLIVRFNL